MSKYIIVTGGVISGLGKGVTASSIGQLMRLRGLRIFMQKMDTYLNFDPGTMNPNQHGEVFVTEDGAEADLDLGHYERFTDENTSRESNVTGGRIYHAAISGERKGLYTGETIQVVPHITNLIKDRLRAAADSSKADIVIVELGGTVGDMESPPFLEAFAQFRREIGRENIYFVHQTLVPYLKNSDEFKTRPTQYSVKDLRALGVEPNAVVLRSELPVPMEIRSKVQRLCALPENSVFESHDKEIIYEMISDLKSQGIDESILSHFGMDLPEADVSQWENLVSTIRLSGERVKISLVGKYTSLRDAYISVYEALKHGGYANQTSVHINWVDSDSADEDEVILAIQGSDGIIVPGGFGARGTEGKMAAIRYARETNTPFLGICYGMQLAAIEYARNVVGIESASSIEIDPDCQHPVVSLQRGRSETEDLGGTLRLGSFKCDISRDSLLWEIYGEDTVSERHRHRYEINNDYVSIMEAAGLTFSGVNKELDLVEALEIKGHPFFLGVQFHPEFKSRPLNAHPIYRDFIRASLIKKLGSTPSKK